MSTLRKWNLAVVLACIVGVIGCKNDPPPPEEDPDKIKKVEQQAEDAAKREGKALKQ